MQITKAAWFSSVLAHVSFTGIYHGALILQIQIYLSSFSQHRREQKKKITIKTDPG